MCATCKFIAWYKKSLWATGSIIIRLLGASALELIFLYAAKWYLIYKINLVDLYLELKASVLIPLEENYKRRKTNIHN